jgi:GDSL-like lipase/acylhydrolase family protein
MTPRGRAIAGTAALALGSLLLTLSALEGALRLLHYQPKRFRNTARVVDSRWRALLDCYPTNPRGYFDIDLRDSATRERYRWMAPVRLDAVAQRAPWAVEFRYNTLRFRDAELGPKPPGVRRVMVLGDSFTEGQGVKEPDTYPRRLEALLNASGTGRWEVRNCGRRATDFPELYTAFDQILPFAPDVVLYGMVLNDADRSPEFQARQTYVNDWILDRERIVEGPSAPAAPGPFDLRLGALIEERLEGYRTSRATLRWYRDMYGEPNREGWARTQQYLRQMNERTRAAGGRLLVATWPLLVALDRYPFVEVHHTIARACLAAGIPQVDLLPALRGRPTESLWVHPVDMHPNEVAHRLAAEALVQPVLSLR